MKNSLLFFLSSLCLSFLPHISVAQAPALGSASSYVIFSSNGAIGNTGISHLTGDIGTNTGAITAFGNVNGVMHNSDGSTNAAQTDLSMAYNQLDTMTPDYFPGVLLGNNDTFLPGVYAFAANTTLNEALTLDASGDTGAIFVFKIQGAFSSAAAAQVRLINGAQACNVFWKAEGLVSLASGTQMKGTIIANNAAIDIGSDVQLEGRALSTTGAININSTTASLPLGCGSPVLSGPVAPSLASTACYALFTGNGANVNSGLSIVNGDIGTNVGLTTGYDSLTVTGVIHPIPDTSTAVAAADLINVYTYLNTLPYDIELLYPAQFGNQLVLTPHTYLLNAATSFTDTLFLNAQGNPDAVFVIQINGALSTATYATVVLINGAQAANVFWKVDGAVDINDYSVFKGTIVCNNGAVNLNTGISIEGRALTTNGALTTNAINTILPPGCSNIPLPLDWDYFEAYELNGQIVLKWKVAREMNDGYFTLEKSTDSKNFEAIYKVASNGTAADYSFNDVRPAPVGYYRVLHTDISGMYKFSKTIRIAIHGQQASEAFILYPNPVQNVLHIDRTGAITTNNAEIIIYNMFGSELIRKMLLDRESIALNNLASGIYYYKIISGEGIIQSGKFSKQR